ncbi:MAG: phosphatase [Bacteroidota bacterium]
MRIAIIDLGTNIFNLFIAEIDTSKSTFLRTSHVFQGKKECVTFKKLYKTKFPVKLGEGYTEKNFITPTAFERGITTLKIYKKIISDYGVKKIIAFATSAIRSASNGKKFVRQAKKETGIKIKIISGEREAQLIYYGVKHALDIGKNPSLIMDIGGGSTEFIIANRKKIFWKQSFDIGVARLLEKFKPSDTIKKKEIKQIENYLEQNLQPLFKVVTRFSSTLVPSGKRIGKITELIGSSGSFDTFAEMIAHRFYSPKILKGKSEYVFKMNDYKKIHHYLLTSNKQKRISMSGLIEMRADMIVIASIFTNFILKKFHFSKMRLSNYSLKEGALFELLK